MARYEDITGQTFNNLTAVSYMESGEKGGARWLYRCACGGEKIANATEVKRGKTKSCGCLALVQKIAAAQTKCHPYSRKNMYRERKSWENMMDRCYNQNNREFCAYGGRGITVCEKWRESFPAFVQDMGTRPPDTTIDRINNSLGYSAENCRWSSRSEQANNRRTNRLVTAEGKTQTVAQWAVEKGVQPFLIHTRLYNGWSEHAAVTLPKGSKKA